MDILNRYLEFLWNTFQSDIHNLSQGWLYYWLLIPAIGYIFFFILKWILLTAPVWLPTIIIIRASNLPSPKCEGCAYRHSNEITKLNDISISNKPEIKE